MDMTEIERFNADWLKAWSDKDVERLLTFYTEDADYLDPQVPAGIKGHDALRAYADSGMLAAGALRGFPGVEIGALEFVVRIRRRLRRDRGRGATCRRPSRRWS